MSGLIRPKIELNQAFMPVLVTINFHDDLITMNELAWRQHFPIISLWEFFRRSREANSVVSGLIWTKFELVQDFMHVLVTCKYKKDQTKSSRKKGGDTIFPFVSQWELSVVMDTSFYPICLKTLCSLSAPLVMLLIKFHQDWPTGLRDIQVRKCKIFVIQGQVTPQWVVWFGPKSNSSELLYLSWLPATLMMIRSKMKALARRQHFPIISLWEIF